MRTAGALAVSATVRRLLGTLSRWRFRRPALRPITQTHPTFAPGAVDHGAFVTVGGIFQLGSGGFTSAIQPIEFAERASIETRYGSAAMPGFDIGGGARVWRRLSAAANIERVSKSGGAQVSGQVPHPFFFNRFRSVAGEATNLGRTETSVHMQAIWVVPLTGKVDLGVGGGPSWISVAMDQVSDINVTQTYPYDTATFGSAVSRSQTQGAIGVNLGMTLDYRIARRLAVMGTARYSHARVRFDVAGSSAVSVDAGGAHTGARVRVRF